MALTFVALVVIAPVAEEALMRGFLFGALRRRLPFIWSTLITSAMFASLHLAGGEQGAGPLWVAAIDTFTLSLALCYLREKTGRLWAGIGLHMLKNGIAFVALFIIGINT
jgi:membrane protease YdiL (CAAX protease family)